MLASMNSAVAGLSAHMTKMNVIGNNIANVNTYGFKSSRTTFSDVFYQTMATATGATATVGGTNPTQLGYGSAINSVDVLYTQAGSTTTGRALDVYINGDGFLGVTDSNGTVKYTRVGILSIDTAGNLVDSNGNYVLGFALDTESGLAQLASDGTTTVQDLVAIKIDPEELDKYSSIAIGENGEITAIKTGIQTYTQGQISWITGSEPLGEEDTLAGAVKLTSVVPSDSVTFTQNAAETGDPAQPLIGATGTTGITSVTLATGDLDICGKASVSYDASGTGTYALSYIDSDGIHKSIPGATLQGSAPAQTLTFAIPEKTGGGTSDLVVTVHDPAALQAAGSVVVGTVTPDQLKITMSTNNKAGETLTSTIDYPVSSTGSGVLSFPTEDGTLTLQIDNEKLYNIAAAGGTATGISTLETSIGTIAAGDGVAVKIGQIAIAKFANNDGLSQIGNSYYTQSSNSGEAVISIPGNNGTGTLLAGSLEMANVDLSKEFTEMITTQRGFQANTRMITVSDEMLEELVGMVR